MRDVYIQKEYIIKEISNGEETTYFIKGKITNKKNKWKDVILIFSE